LNILTNKYYPIIIGEVYSSIGFLGIIANN
jgi:hypothetical protein